MIQKLMWLALAGALGTVTRYGLVGIIRRFSSLTPLWGTLIVNVSGCFFAGLLWALFETRYPVSGETRVIVLIGFLGAFTTFSALILESSELIQSAKWLMAMVNIISHNSLGFAAMFAGIMLGKSL
ncbi:MAG: CrcB family protein [bacterium]|nr:CrcB family protein [bacterium]